MNDPDQEKSRKLPRTLSHWHPVDVVALVLSLGLTAAICLILIVTGVQVFKGGSFPKVELSENATQILISGIGGMTGLLGAYIGLNRKSKREKNGDTPPPSEDEA